MRIIGGTARGKTLVAPEGLDTRPTSDRLREALFNILAPRVPDARVLDLFGGTGALSAEALSRGAAYAAVVDLAPQAARAIRKNCDLKGVSGRAEVFECDWRKAVGRLRGPFDIVFLDPPYRMTEVYAEAFLALAGTGLLAEDAVVVMEYAADARIPLPEEADVFDERKYGAARVKFVRVRQKGEVE